MKVAICNAKNFIFQTCTYAVMKHKYNTVQCIMRALFGLISKSLSVKSIAKGIAFRAVA